jgi:hypothetical protein
MTRGALHRQVFGGERGIRREGRLLHGHCWQVDATVLIRVLSQKGRTRWDGRVDGRQRGQGITRHVVVEHYRARCDENASRQLLLAAVAGHLCTLNTSCLEAITVEKLIRKEADGYQKSARSS